MNAAHHVIRHRLVLELAGPESPTSLDAELRYDPTDPYAVTLALVRDDDEVVWVFARDLMLSGVTEPAGLGDVHVFPSVDADGSAVVAIVLRGPTGEALLTGRTRDFLSFLGRTTRAVWPGTERDAGLSVDTAIAEFLVGD
jgi:hypothetical protein